MAELYPEIEPFDEGYLKVSERHTVFYERVGNPRGKPVIFLHGGPGGGITPSYRRYFDPAKYHVVLMDQRGCGKSTPFAELQENTTWHIVEDIERLREHLGLDKWAVFGGSWGSTLALAYAEKHPDSVSGLFLRGIFLCRQKELDWFYGGGCARFYPDAWEKYLEPIPEDERGDFIAAYHKRLTSPDAEVRAAAAKAWSVWEASTSKLVQDPSLMKAFAGGAFADAFARIECHYFINKIFMDDEQQLLRDVGRIRHIPTFIAQGRYDVVCPPESAWELHRAFPEAEFVMVQDAGHSLSEKGLTSALVDATDRYWDRL